MEYSALTSKEKAAVLVISLGKDASSKIYKYLSNDEIEQLTLSITGLTKVGSNDKETVVNEFYELCIAQRYIAEGGIEYARDVLVAAIGDDRASEVLNRLSLLMQVRPFDFVRKADAMQILNFIQNEHPQTIALVLCYLETSQAAVVIAALEPQIQSKVIKRMAKMGMVSPEYIREAEVILERKLLSSGSADNIAVGGIDSIIDILNFVDRRTESSILSSLEIEDPELAEEIHRKLFVFEDICKLENSALQRVLRDVDNDTLAIALKGASADIVKKINANISKRLQDMLKDNMEFMGPVRVRDVEGAQQKIVAVIRRLEDENEIDVSRGGHDDEVVV